MRRTTILTALASLALPLGLPAASAQAVGETCDGKQATIVVAPSPDQPPTDLSETAPVVGTPGDDVIVGTAARDTIDGGAGDDTICALGGDDTVHGGAGNDRLFGGLDGIYVVGEAFWGDTIIPGPGDDHIDLGHDPQAEDLWFGDRGYWDQISFRDATSGVTVDLAVGAATGEGTDTIAPVVFAAGIEGSDHDDVLFGSDMDDRINAGGGDDVVEGRDGRDVIEADRLTPPLLDPLPARHGDDLVNGGLGRDEITGGHGADRLRGGGGRDEVRIEKARDTRAWGGKGRDSLGGFTTARSGTAALIGGPGDDVLSPWIVRAGDKAIVRGGPGRDTLAAGLTLRVAPHRSTIVVRVPRGTMRTRTGTVVGFSGIESYVFQSQSTSAHLRWYGSARSESLDAQEQEVPVRAFGRAGGDRIRGGRASDVLDGGSGRDRLNGWKGRDRCVAGERLKSCERRR